MKTYTVIYRTGGTENFKWHKTVEYQSYQSAASSMQDIVKGGRIAMIFDTSLLSSIGLPETFDYNPKSNISAIYD